MLPFSRAQSCCLACRHLSLHPAHSPGAFYAASAALALAQFLWHYPTNATPLFTTDLGPVALLLKQARGAGMVLAGERQSCTCACMHAGTMLVFAMLSGADDTCSRKAKSGRHAGPRWADDMAVAQSVVPLRSVRHEFLVDYAFAQCTHVVAAGLDLVGMLPPACRCGVVHAEGRC